MSRFSGMHRLILTALLVLSAILPARAQQGQYHLSNIPFTRAGNGSPSGLATYSPILAVYGSLIQLHSDDGQIFSFNLSSDTIFCEGSVRVQDWSYLKSVKKKNSVTILAFDDDSKKAAVIWDHAPSISISSGQVVFSLPPMCK